MDTTFLTKQLQLLLFRYSILTSLGIKVLIASPMGKQKTISKVYRVELVQKFLNFMNLEFYTALSKYTKMPILHRYFHTISVWHVVRKFFLFPI